MDAYSNRVSDANNYTHGNLDSHDCSDTNADAYTYGYQLSDIHRHVEQHTRTDRDYDSNTASHVYCNTDVTAQCNHDTDRDPNSYADGYLHAGS
jgi:hypothetical protein